MEKHHSGLPHSTDPKIDFSEKIDKEMALVFLLVGNKIFQPTTQTDSDFISRTLEKWVYYCAGALRFIPSGGGAVAGGGG